ncbi:MAG: hypothetical protein IPN22_11360 [Bacteroidetes bacterium]|nr:hypothetical protein [Bacteroidota bacterium]
MVFILAVAAALRVYFFNHFPLVTIEGDAMCRFIQSYEFDYLEGSFLKPGALVWLPFHHFFLYLGIVAHPSYPLMGAN